MAGTSEVIQNDLGVREIGMAALSLARRVTMGLLEDIPENQWLYQPFAGANHAAWLAGHIALNDDNFLTGLSGCNPRVPTDWKALFGAGSTVSNNLEAYPPRSKIVAQLESRRDDLTVWFRNLPADRLMAPVPEQWQRFGATYGHLMSALAWHEGLHAGQLTVIRRGLGLGPKFG